MLTDKESANICNKLVESFKKFNSNDNIKIIITDDVESLIIRLYHNYSIYRNNNELNNKVEDVNNVD